MGDLEENLLSWLRIGAAPALEVTLGVNHQMEDISLCLSSSLYISDLAIKINKSLFFKGEKKMFRAQIRMCRHMLTYRKDEK